MHLTKGGFKIINGPPKMGKGPMESEESLKSSNKASQPQPTQAGRIETCMELIKQARECLNNDNKECAMKLIELLIKNQCHDGRLIGKEIADGVREIVHELWLVSNHEEECRLLMILRTLGVSKKWARKATRITSLQHFNERLGRCGIDWENKAVRYEVVKKIENLLRRMGWSEVRMCEEMWRFVGVDVDEFRKYGVEPCVWLSGLELLSNLRRSYWLGMRTSDLSVKKYKGEVRLVLMTTNSVDVVFFPVLLSMIKMPSLRIAWKSKAPTAKYVHKSIALSFYVDLGIDEWPWPIKLSANELVRIIEGFSDEELAMFVAGLIDGDGIVQYERTPYLWITVCKACPKRFILDVLKEVIARRFGVIGSVDSLKTEDALKIGGKDAVKLLRHIAKYIHHPLRRLRAELILALYDGKISKDEFTKLYEQTKYERGASDVKRNHALAATARAAPQTHTHGDKNRRVKTKLIRPGFELASSLK
jgi:hypothetical protein